MNGSHRGGATTLKMLIQLETTETLPISLMTDTRTREHILRRHIRTFSESHCSNCHRSTQVPFVLDIPSDGTPDFEIYDSSRSDVPKGLGWQLRLQILIATHSSTHTVKGGQRTLTRDKTPSEWDYTYTASESFIPLERHQSLSKVPSNITAKGGWLSYLIPTSTSGTQGMDEVYNLGGPIEPISDSLLRNSCAEVETTSAAKHWKGKRKEGFVEPDGLGEEHEWRKMQPEMLECVIPIRVWPGNTEYRPNEIAFQL